MIIYIFTDFIVFFQPRSDFFIFVNLFFEHHSIIQLAFISLDSVLKPPKKTTNKQTKQNKTKKQLYPIMIFQLNQFVHLASKLFSSLFF